MIIINVYHGGKILKGPAGVDYDRSANFSFHVTDCTSFDEVMTQIYVGIGILPSQFKLKISARLNTAPHGSFFIIYLWWTMMLYGR
jgi:hypothetical protein